MPAPINPPTRPVLRWEYLNESYQYPLTDLDQLDFARSVWREGKPQLAVAFTLLQRFAFLYSTTRPYKTLSAFLRAYVQPINPRWFSAGDLHLAYVAQLQRANKTAEIADENARAKKREQYAVTPITQIPIEHRRLVAQVLGGQLRSPVPMAMHFSVSKAAPSDNGITARTKALATALQKGLQLVPIAEGYMSGLNWFYATANRPPEVRFTELRTTGMWASIGATALLGGLMFASLGGFEKLGKILFGRGNNER